MFAKKGKIGFVSISHPDYLEPMVYNASNQAASAVERAGFILFRIEKSIIDWQSAVNAGVKLASQDLAGVVLFLATGHLIYHHMLFRKFASRKITKNACRGRFPEPHKSSAHRYRFSKPLRVCCGLIPRRNKLICVHGRRKNKRNEAAEYSKSARHTLSRYTTSRRSCGIFIRCCWVCR